MKNKRIFNMAITFMLVSSGIMAMLQITDTPLTFKAAAAPVQTGDVYGGETTIWYINGTTIYRNTSLTVKSNITMTNWGNLLLDNTTMYIECPVNTSWVLGQAPGGANTTNASGLRTRNSNLYINNTDTCVNWTIRANITFISSTFKGLCWLQPTLRTPKVGYPSYPDITVSKSKLYFRYPTDAGTKVNFQVSYSNRITMQKNNYYNDFAYSGSCRFYRPTATVNNKYQNIGNSTYYSNTTHEGGFSMSSDTILNLWNETRVSNRSVSNTLIGNGIICIYEPVKISLVDHEGTPISTNVSIYQMGNGTWHNTTTDTVVCLFAGRLDNSRFLEPPGGAATTGWNITNDYRFNITFPLITNYGAYKILNMSVMNHEMYTSDRYMRSSNYHYTRYDYNITLTISPFWRMDDSFVMPIMIRVDDYRNTTNWTTEKPDYDMFYQTVVTDHGMKFNFFCNEIWELQDPFPPLQVAARADERWWSWARNHSTSRTDSLEFGSHDPYHNSHAGLERRTIQSIYQNWSFAYNHSVDNFSYAYWGMAFPNDDYAEPNGTIVMKMFNVKWVATPDGEKTDYGNVSGLMKISSAWLYFTHWETLSNQRARKIPIMEECGMATFDGYQAHHQYKKAAPYIAFTNHVYSLMRNYSNNAWNATKWDLWNRTLDDINSLYGDVITPMTYSQYFMYRTNMENITYTQLSDRWIVDATDCPYNIEFRAYKLYGDDTRVYDLTTGTEISYTEGSIIWTLTAGHEYAITDHSLASEILASGISESLLTFLPLIILLALLTAALAEAGIKLNRRH